MSEAVVSMVVFTEAMVGGIYRAFVRTPEGWTIAACRHNHKSFDAARKCGFKMRRAAERAAPGVEEGQ